MTVAVHRIRPVYPYHVAIAYLNGHLTRNEFFERLFVWGWDS